MKFTQRRRCTQCAALKNKTGECILGIRTRPAFDAFRFNQKRYEPLAACYKPMTIADTESARELQNNPNAATRRRITPRSGK